jgi:hypothetical protein
LTDTTTEIDAAALVAIPTAGASRERGWERLTAMVLDGVISPHSRRAYATALEEFFTWWDGEGRPSFVKATVHAFRAKLEVDGLAPATINTRLSAVRKLAAEAADNGLIDPAIAAGIGRVRGVKRLGVRMGNWLTVEQARRLLAASNAAGRGQSALVLRVFARVTVRPVQRVPVGALPEIRIVEGQPTLAEHRLQRLQHVTARGQEHDRLPVDDVFLSASSRIASGCR